MIGSWVVSAASGSNHTLAVPVSALHKVCPPLLTEAGHDSGAPAAKTYLGQQRAIDAIRFGLQVDSEGYNFRHELDVSQNEAFPKAGTVYQVRYELTPVLGQKIVFRFQLKSI